VAFGKKKLKKFSMLSIKELQDLAVGEKGKLRVKAQNELTRRNLTW